MSVAKNLAGRVALVTGGSRGVGRAIALALAEAGADVAINYRRDEASAQATLEALRAQGVRACAVAASVADADACDAMVAQVEAELGPVSILINNAGIASRGLAVADTTAEEVLRVMSTHAFAAHALSKRVLPGMRVQDRGDIIMISSVATRGLGANGAPYNMAKAALEALAMTLAKEERAHGIRVNVVAPGLVDTDMGRRLVAATQGVEDVRTLDATMPFGRVCQPEDVAHVVRYFVSPENSYLTGERVYCDGGGPLAGRRVAE
ncbi:MAG: SDR family oxidoreductase [Proteobacteria bacterium]|jgi:3-oxoacyl-[acyl-carrier protein] reductase|nr:SDR family oxidoreductase [Pseudomonadota bacterium]